MGGRLSIESEPDAGSTFRFSAVLGKSLASEPASAIDEVPAPHVDRALDVLLAEDNAINQHLARRMLEKWGHRVTTVTSGRGATAAAAERHFDLILMDVQMPEMDGFEATAIIRAAENGGHVPIVAMTAHAMNGDREDCLAAGMDGYVAKPIDVRRLREAIDRACASAP